MTNKSKTKAKTPKPQVECRPMPKDGRGELYWQGLKNPSQKGKAEPKGEDGDD